MTKVDLLFAASSRPEFTRASLAALRENTHWDHVRSLWLYVGESVATDEVVTEWLEAGPPLPSPLCYISVVPLGGPVAIMNHWLAETACVQGAHVLAKIDNDVIVPPGWLQAAAGVMNQHPELDLLGLEPPLSRTPAPWSNGQRHPAPELAIPGGARRANLGYAPCEAIGGVGLMRRRAFANRPRMVPHSTYGGFTDWQQRHADLVIGWIVPPLALFLLDRLPLEPWAGLSRRYIADGHQRPWTNYRPGDHQLWDWWLG